MRSAAESRKTRKRLEDRIVVLEHIGAEAYQLTGAVGAPKKTAAASGGAMDKPGTGLDVRQFLCSAPRARG